jgi:hypothetical protein
MYLSVAGQFDGHDDALVCDAEPASPDAAGLGYPIICHWMPPSSGEYSPRIVRGCKHTILWSSILA